jgi:hypothetical protein
MVQHARIVAVALLAGAVAGCGYRVAGGASRVLPPSVHTIAIPAFENQTQAARIEQSLTAAVVQEFLARTRYRVQASTAGSDAILRGVVTSVYSSPTLYDPTVNRTTGVLLTVGLRMSLVSATTGETLYETGDWTYREPYEVSRDPAAYLGENQPALERLSRQVAASLVSTLVEGLR